MWEQESKSEDAKEKSKLGRKTGACLTQYPFYVQKYLKMVESEKLWIWGDKPEGRVEVVQEIKFAIVFFIICC